MPTNSSRAQSALRLASTAIGLALAAWSTAEADEKVYADNTLSGVIVEGTRGNALSHDTGLAVMPVTIQDMPQAINVVPKELLDAQAVKTLGDALKNVPGITIAIGEGGTLAGDQFRIRGQDASSDTYLDGLRDFGVYTRDSFNYDEVQVLKGPSGALFGRGAVGGVVNAISKSPKLADSSTLEATWGDGAYYRATGDFNKALGESTAVRLNLMGQANHVVGRDYINDKRWGAAASIGFGLGTNTSFALSYLHQHDDRRPDYGITIVQPPGSLIALPASEYNVGVESSSYLGYLPDHDRTDGDIVTAKFTHQPNSWLTINSDTRVGVYSRYFAYTTTDTCDATCTTNLFDNNPATIAAGAIGGGGPYNQDAWGAQNITTARITHPIAGHENLLIAGVDLSYQYNKRQFLAYTLPAGLTSRRSIVRDLVNPSPNYPAGYTMFLANPTSVACVGTNPCTTTVNGTLQTTSVTSTTAMLNTSSSTDMGVFITDQFHFAPHWSLLGSLRLDGYRSEFTATTVLGVASTLAANSTLFNPRVSLVYEPTKSQTYYASYGKAATPQGNSVVGSATALAITTKDLQPEESDTYEIGAKINVLGERLGLTGSVYRIEKSNATQTDPSTGFLLAQSGQSQEFNGVELGATGKITSDWSLQASYSLIDSKVTSDNSCGTVSGATVCKPNIYTIGKPVTFVPKNAATIWTSVALDRVLRGLEIGGGVTWQDKVIVGYTAAGTAPNLTGLSRISEVPENIELDAMVSYRFGRYHIQLNGQNLTDRLNYAQLFGNRAVPAPGRTLLLTLGAAF